MKRVGLLAGMVVLANFMSWAVVWVGGYSNTVAVTRGGPSPAVGQQVYDVTVTSVSLSTSSVSRGKVVSVNVTTQNLGSTTETFNVNLRDDTDD